MTARLLPGVVAVVLPLVVVLSACDEEIVALATIPPDDAGVHSPAQRCLSSEACPDGSYCDKRGCATAAGMCVPFPAFCDNGEAPVCGCDGVTYFNDCLRRAAGTSGSMPGACEELAWRCREDEDCSGTAVCAKLLGFRESLPCEATPEGTCWVVPVVCPAPTGTNMWKECGKEKPPCTDACTAILTGNVYARASKCGQ